MDEVKTWRGIDLALAVAAAVIVAYGVLVLGWSVFVVIALFWFENVVIGVFQVAKMLTTGARTGHTVSMIVALKLAFDIVAGNAAARTGGSPQLMPVRHFFTSHEDDARRP